MGRSGRPPGLGGPILCQGRRLRGLYAVAPGAALCAAPRWDAASARVAPFPAMVHSPLRRAGYCGTGGHVRKRAARALHTRVTPCARPAAPPPRAARRSASKHLHTRTAPPRRPSIAPLGCPEVATRSVVRAAAWWAWHRARNAEGARSGRTWGGLASPRIALMTGFINTSSDRTMEAARRRRGSLLGAAPPAPRSRSMTAAPGGVPRAPELRPRSWVVHGVQQHSVLQHARRARCWCNSW